jgi:hypothetical protein
VDASGMDMADRARARLALSSVMDALRDGDAGRVVMEITDGEDHSVTTEGYVLSLHGSCIPTAEDRHAAALFLEAMVNTPWRIDGACPSVQNEIADRIAPVADAARALGHGIERRMAICLPTPTTGARAVTGTQSDPRVDAIVDHLLGDCPSYVTLVRIDDLLRIYPMGARIQQPGPVRDPVAAMRLLSTIPQELLP